MKLEEWRKYVEEQIEKAKKYKSEEASPQTKEDEKEIKIVDPMEVLIQKDKKEAEIKEKEKIEPQLEDPIKILTQRDKKVIENEELKEEAKTKREELLNRLLDPHITLEEAALILKVSKQTIRRYTDQNLLPHFRTDGGQRRFKLSDVLAFSQRYQDKIIKEEVQ